MHLLLFIISTALYISFFLSFFSHSLYAQVTSFQRKLAYVHNEVVLKYTSVVERNNLENNLRQFGFTPLKHFHHCKVNQLKIPSGMDLTKALETLRSYKGVQYVEPNYYWFSNGIPNDSYFDRLWGLHNTGQEVFGSGGAVDADIDAPRAWDLTTGDSSVIVAVVGSGVDSLHPDLKRNIWENPGEIAGNGIDDDGNGYLDDTHGWDFVHNDNEPMDSFGHGTHVAGSIAAIGNNARGVAGVSWSATIMPIRFSDAQGIGTTANAIAAIEYANDNGAQVINCSWGGPNYSQALKDAIEASPAVVVCSAGNGRKNTDISPEYPASYSSPNIMSVAASTLTDALYSASNYGMDTVDLAAPGKSIFSTVPSRKVFWEDSFDDGAIDNWATGGNRNKWSVTRDSAYRGYALTDSPAGDYDNNTDSWARMPGLDLASQSGSVLHFLVKADLQPQDILYVQASSDGSSWDTQAVIRNTFGQWYRYRLELGRYDRGRSIDIRFYLSTDSQGISDGVYIDNVRIETSSSSYDGTEYMYMSGTSMSAAIVSGVCALTLAQNNWMSNLELKRSIEDNVDKKQSLSGYVATRGRVNACKTLDPASDFCDQDYTSSSSSGGSGGGGCIMNRNSEDVILLFFLVCVGLFAGLKRRRCR